MFKFQAVLARTQPFLSRSVEKRGDQSRFKCRKVVNYCAIRSKCRRFPYRLLAVPSPSKHLRAAHDQRNIVNESRTCKANM
jgi:hypothetical protein